MKLYMHWDMEGTSGLFSREQTWVWEKGVRPEVMEAGMNLLMADVESAVKAALAAGAERVEVCDTHRGGGNLVPARMFADPRVAYHTVSRDANGRLLPGLDESFAGLLLMGHHGKAGTPGEFLPHTWMIEWADVRLNGVSVGEIGLEACFAASLGVPPVMVHGTEAACREAEALLPGIVTAGVKRGTSYDEAVGMPAADGRALTDRKVAEAVAAARERRFAPYRPALPLTVTIRMTTPAAAEAAVRKAGAKRVDDLTIEGIVTNYADVVDWLLQPHRR